MKVPANKITTRTTNVHSEQSTVDLEDQIRRRAYELYERRGREDGHETEDWLEATLLSPAPGRIPEGSA